MLSKGATANMDYEDPCSQSRENSPRAGNVAIFIGQKVFECVKGKKANCGFKSISDD